MRKMPVDINTVLKAMTDIDEARQRELYVALLVDPTAPKEYRECLTAAFRVDTPLVTVEHRDFTRIGATVRIDCDVAVLVAGDSPETGPMVKTLQNDGIPAVVVTASPTQVMDLARATGDALSPKDVIAANPGIDGIRFALNDKLNTEPYPLTIDRERVMIERLGEWFTATFQRKRLSFALAFPFVRKPYARSVINLTSLENATIGIVPLIPGADMPLMTANQAKMVLQIAAAYGMDIGTERWRELLATVGSGFAGRSVARKLTDAVPVFGWAIRGGVGAGMTEALGHATLLWFEHQAQGVYELPDQGSKTTAAKEKARSAWTQAEPFVKTVTAAAAPLVSQTAQTLAHAATAAAPQVGHAVRKVADICAPVTIRVGRQVSPIVARMIEDLVPGLHTTIEEFCKRQHIDPDTFMADFLSAYRVRRGR